LQKDKVLPGKLTLWLLPLVLIPMAWRKKATGGDRARSIAASAVVFGIPTLSVFIGMGWVFYFDRYLMPFSALLAMAVPVAFGRLCALKKPHILRWVAALGATAWSVLIWPGVDAVGLHSPHTQASADMSAGAAAKWAKATMSTSDRMFDCGGLALDYLLLPQQIDYVRHPPGDRACESLIRNPGTTDGRTFLITAHRPGQQDLAADALAIQSLGWQAMDPPDQLGPYQLWVHGKAP
jgi:hypothetical protein